MQGNRCSPFLYSLLYFLICIAALKCVFLFSDLHLCSQIVFCLFFVCFFTINLTLTQHTSGTIKIPIQFKSDRLTGLVSRYKRDTHTCFRDDGALFGRAWRPPLLASTGSLQLLLRVGAVMVPESDGWDSGFR